MILRLSFIFISWLLQLSSFAGNANEIDFKKISEEVAQEQMFFSASERNIFQAGEKNTVRFVVRQAEKGNKKITENTAVISTHFYHYFSQRFNRLIVSHRCESIPVFVLLRDFRI